MSDRPRDDLELIDLIKHNTRFVPDPKLKSPKAKLEMIEQFLDDYNNTDQDTVLFAPEFKIVVESILHGLRPVKLHYLTEFDGEDTT